MKEEKALKAVIYTNIQYAKNYVEPVIEAVAEKHNSEIIKAYFEIGDSVKEEGPEFKKMINYIRKKDNVKIVYFYNVPGRDVKSFINRDIKTVIIRVAS